MTTKTTSKVTIEQLGIALDNIRKEFPDYDAELMVGLKALRRIWKQLDNGEMSVLRQAKEVVNNAEAKILEVTPVAEAQAPQEEEKTDEPEALGKEHPEHVVGNGYYTVQFPDGSHRTFRLRPHWEEVEAAKGVQVAHLLTGPDNETSYTGIAFVKGSKVFMWKKFKGDTKAIHGLQFLINGGSVEAGELFAMKSGKCWKCNHKLTVPVSIHRGLGPICAKKLGLS